MINPRVPPLLVPPGGGISITQNDPRVPPSLISPLKKTDGNYSLPGAVDNIQTFFSSNSELILFGILLYFAVKK